MSEKLLPGWVDNDGVCRALDPETWQAFQLEGEVACHLNARQREEAKEKWRILATDPQTFSLMYDCDGFFFRLVRLEPADHATLAKGLIPESGPRRPRSDRGDGFPRL